MVPPGRHRSQSGPEWRQLPGLGGRTVRRAFGASGWSWGESVGRFLGVDGGVVALLCVGGLGSGLEAAPHPTNARESDGCQGVWCRAAAWMRQRLTPGLTPGRGGWRR